MGGSTPANRVVIRRLVLGALLLSLGCAGTDTSHETDWNKPATNDERTLSAIELLGKRLFEDGSLSMPPGTSCRSCHDPEGAYQSSHGSHVAGVAAGSLPGALTARNPPSLMYASLVPPFDFRVTGDGSATCTGALVPSGGLFWDGRADTLEEQAKGPLTNPREMNASAESVVLAVREGAYSDLARRVMGDRVLGKTDLAFDAVASALAAFERTARFSPYSSRFDDYLRGTATLTSTEDRGLSAFLDPARGNCVACHTAKVGSHDPRDWPLTNYRYEAIGAPRNTAIPDNHDAAHFDMGLCQRPGLGAVLPPGVRLASLCGMFRVPTLRNVARTAPYFHNGSFSTLEDVVFFYATRDTEPANFYPIDSHFFLRRFDDLPSELEGNVSDDEVPYDRALGQSPRLSPEDIRDIVAFLRTLSDR
jgi:cytochrome c peroxidase